MSSSSSWFTLCGFGTLLDGGLGCGMAVVLAGVSAVDARRSEAFAWCTFVALVFTECVILST